MLHSLFETAKNYKIERKKETNLEPLTAILTSKEVTMTIENLWTPLLKVMAEENEDTEEHGEGDGDDH